MGLEPEPAEEVARARFGGRWVVAGLAILTLLSARPVSGQLPGLPAAVQGKGPAATQGGAGPDAEKAKPAVATATGPIALHQRVSSGEIKRFLTKFLPKYPGVESIDVVVDEGVVTLTGRVDDDSTQDEITGVVSRVEGVRWSPHWSRYQETANASVATATTRSGSVARWSTGRSPSR